MFRREIDDILGGFNKLQTRLEKAVAVRERKVARGETTRSLLVAAQRRVEAEIEQTYGDIDRATRVIGKIRELID